MHVGPYGGVAERIDPDAVGSANPTTQGSEFGGVHLVPANLGRLYFLLGDGDGLGDSALEVRRISRIRLGSQAAESGGCRVSVGGGDQNSVTRNPGSLGRKGLGLVEHGSGHHATVHHYDGDFRLAVRQYEGLGVDGVGYSVRASTDHAAVDPHGKFLGAYAKGVALLGIRHGKRAPKQGTGP